MLKINHIFYRQVEFTSLFADVNHCSKEMFSPLGASPSNQTNTVSSTDIGDLLAATRSMVTWIRSCNVNLAASNSFSNLEHDWAPESAGAVILVAVTVGALLSKAAIISRGHWHCKFNFMNRDLRHCDCEEAFHTSYSLYVTIVKWLCGRRISLEDRFRNYNMIHCIIWLRINLLPGHIFADQWTLTNRVILYWL